MLSFQYPSGSLVVRLMGAALRENLYIFRIPFLSPHYINFSYYYRGKIAQKGGPGKRKGNKKGHALRAI